MSKKRVTNEELIDNYLNFYQHSRQSVKMRESSLNYFFGEIINNKRENKK